MRKKKGDIFLTKEEKDIIILAAAHPLSSNKLSYDEIAQRLGISVSRVRRLMHQSFIKLGVHNRIEAVRHVKRYGLISLKDFYSLDELAELYSPLGPEKTRRIAHLIRRGSGYKHLTRDDRRIMFTGRKRDPCLTKRERDVIICVGRGLTNREIAAKLYISISSVETFICRACRKLGAANRTDAFIVALKQKEIVLGDICSTNELLQMLKPLGPESIEKMAQMMEKEPS